MFKQDMIIQKTAEELLFGGYNDPMIGIWRDIVKDMGESDLPFEKNKFGWFMNVSFCFFSLKYYTYFYFSF